MTLRSLPPFIALLLTGLFVVGCFGPPEVQMQVQGTTEMNSGGNPAVVRIYQLSGESRFVQSSAADFWSDDVGQLGGDLLAPPQDLTIYPDEKRTLTLEPNKNAQFIGIAANLRSPNSDQWRAVHPVSRLKGKTLTLQVLSDRLSVEF